MNKKPFFQLAIPLTGLLIGLSSAALADTTADTVNVYSARKEALIKPLLDRFTQETGIRVNLVTAKADALLARLKLEGEHSPADVLITTDAGRLHRAKIGGLLQKTSSPLLNKVIPKNYRDPDSHWFGLSVRARTIMTVTGRMDASAVNSYESLAAPKLSGRICIRSSNNIYNQSLVASMIAAHGEEATLKWARGLVANFARPPTGGDRDQILATAGGGCDVAVANTYYLAMMLTGGDPRHQQAAGKMIVLWPNQNGRGVHTNVSGAGVTSAAAGRNGAGAAAVRLIEFLVSKPSQRWYAEANHEYPVIAGMEASPVLKAWGDFKHDPLNLEKLGELNTAAIKLMDRAGWE